MIIGCPPEVSLYTISHVHRWTAICRAGSTSERTSWQFRFCSQRTKCSDNSTDVTHFFLICQTLCILANIADGNTAKELIMTNDDMLQKIKYYMVLYIITSTVAQPCSLFIRSSVWCCCIMHTDSLLLPLHSWHVVSTLNRSSHGKQILQYVVPTEDNTVVFFSS